MLPRRGLALEYTTLASNVAGTAVLILGALAAGSVALAGFGVDSLIEIVASTVVVWQLNGGVGAGRERRALRIIAIAFVLPAVYMAAQAAVTVSSASHPGHSGLGIARLALTILIILALAAGKRNSGERPSNALVILVCGLREARHAWAEAA